MMKKLNILLIAMFLVLSCAPFQQVSTTLGLLAATAKAQVGLVDQTPTPEPTAVPSPTPTLGPLSEPVAMTRGEDFEVWDLLQEPDFPGTDLMLHSKEGYALDPDWDVNRIDFVYKWWGNGNPVLNYQYLWKSNKNFLHSSGKSIPAETVSAFLAAISGLQAEPNILSSLSHKDDYHAWYIELAGEDGQTVLIQSTSNTSRDGTPWNVIYNGRVYAQLNGDLFNALEEIFPHTPYEPEFPFAESNTTGFVPYSVERSNTLISPTYTGLLPLRGDMTLVAGVGNEGITMLIRDYGVNGFINDFVQGAITSVQKVELIDRDNQRVRCSVGENRIAWLGTGWTVSCPVAQEEGEISFRFPIEISFRTLDGHSLTTKGVLQSYWGLTSILQAENLPDWMAEAFATHPLASQLWQDHVLYDLRYVASVNAKDPGKGNLYGEVVLLGESHWNGKTIRYTVSTPFGFENGKLTRWDLNREDIEQSLTAIEQVATNRLVYDATGDAILNLYIGRKGSTPRLPNLVDADVAKYEVHTQACSVNPKIDLPSKETPFIGYAWNGAMQFSDSRSQLFVIAEGTLVPVNYLFYPRDDDPATLAIRPILLEDTRFQGADVVSMSTEEYAKSELLIWLNANSSTRGRNNLRDILEDTFGLTSLDRDNEYYWVVESTTLVVNPDGTLSFAKCE